jgi:hypothetical protein
MAHNQKKRRNSNGYVLDVREVLGGGGEKNQRQTYQGCRHRLEVAAAEAMYSMLGKRSALYPDLSADGTGDESLRALGKMTGIAFTTCPAVTVEEFDKLMGRV